MTRYPFRSWWGVLCLVVIVGMGVAWVVEGLWR